MNITVNQIQYTSTSIQCGVVIKATYPVFVSVGPYHPRHPALYCGSSPQTYPVFVSVGLHHPRHPALYCGSSPQTVPATSVFSSLCSLCVPAFDALSNITVSQTNIFAQCVDNLAGTRNKLKANCVFSLTTGVVIVNVLDASLQSGGAICAAVTLMIFRHISRSVTSCDAAAMSSLAHSLKSWNQVVAGLPLPRLPSIFPCISLFSIPFFRTMWPNNHIFLSAILFLNIKTDSIFFNTHGCLYESNLDNPYNP